MRPSVNLPRSVHTIVQKTGCGHRFFRCCENDNNKFRLINMEIILIPALRLAVRDLVKI